MGSRLYIICTLSSVRIVFELSALVYSIRTLHTVCPASLCARVTLASWCVYRLFCPLRSPNMKHICCEGRVLANLRL